MPSIPARLVPFTHGYFLVLVVFFVWYLSGEPTLLVQVIGVGLLLVPLFLVVARLVATSRLHLYFLSVVFLSSVAGLALLSSVKSLREIFPLTTIAPQKVIAFTQFSGYPFSFDTYVTFGVLFSPLIAVVLIRIIHKIWYEKK